jgi:predicted TIM-barrel fold metal-dependent hydrolase
MKEITKIVDFSTWTGHWPFMQLKYNRLDQLKNKLQSLHVVKAFVSPIEAVLEQDMLRANKQLLADVQDDFFSPVLIVDLSYANWEDIMEMAVLDGRVKMVKLLPNYHMYELTEQRIEKLVQLTTQHDMLISIQMRVEDKRGQYPLLKVNDIDVYKAVKTASYFPDQTFILNNLYAHEVSEVLYSVDNVYVDISSLEKVDTLQMLKERFTLNKILFSSHSPYYFAEGNICKLRYTDVSDEDVRQVAYTNAEKLLHRD